MALLKIIWLLACCCMVWLAGYLIQQGIWPQFENWSGARSWQSIEGNITELELKEHRSTETDSDGRRYESLMYEVRTRYQYTIDGNDYSNTRVSFSHSRESRGGYNTQMHSRLGSAKKNNKAVAIWVNPANPWDSVIDRSLRVGDFLFKLVFIVFIAAIGLINIFFALKEWRQRARGQVDESSGGAAFGYSVLALVVLFSFMGFYFAVDGVKSGDLRGLVGLIFPGILIPVTIEFRRYLRKEKSKKSASSHSRLGGIELEPSGSRASVYITILWLMITLPLAYVEMQSALEPTIVSYIIFALAGFGMLFLVRIALRKMAYRNHGQLILRLNPNPLVVGQKCVGKVETQGSNQPKAAQVTIRSFVTEKMGPGASSSYSAFNETFKASSAAQYDSKHLSFEGRLPQDLPKSQNSESLNVTYYLHLETRGILGMKLIYTYEGLRVIEQGS